MRISKNRDYRANAYSKFGNLISIVYDSGFRSLADIFHALERKTVNDFICRITICCDDDGSWCSYKVVGSKLVKEF